MSLTATPVSQSDLTQLQAGIQASTDANAAASVAQQITNGTPGVSVFSYATQLFNSQTAGTQIAMGVDALIEGGVPTAGALVTPFDPVKNELQNAAQNPGAIPSFVAAGAKLGIPDTTVFAAEAFAVSLASGGDGTQNNFSKTFGSFTEAQMAASISQNTGVSVSNVTTFIDNWLRFYNGVGSTAVLPNLNATTQSFAAAYGDAIGNSITAVAKGVTGISDVTKAFVNQIFNALVDNAENIAGIGGGKQYLPGVALANQPQHVQLQGEVTGQTLTFTPGTDQFTGTGGDDTYNGVIAGTGQAPATLSPLQSDFAHDIGGSNDSINLAVAGGGASLSTVAPLVTGVENWHINETQGPITDAGGINVSQLDSAKLIEQIGAPFVDFNHVGTGQTVAFTSPANNPVTNTITVDNGVNSATVQLNDVGAVALNFAETTPGDLTKIEVDGSIQGVAAIDPLAAAVTTDVLGITSNSNIILIGNTKPLQTVDAHTSTGNLTLSVAGGVFPNVNSVTLGSGNDTLTDMLQFKGPAVTTVTENLGAGNDTLNLFLDANAGHNVAMNITLGGGADTVIVSPLTGVFANIVDAANFQQGFVTITDFSPAQDQLNISGAGLSFHVTTAGEQATISAAPTLFAAVQSAAAIDPLGQLMVFNYGTNAYAFENHNAPAFDAGDGFIQLTGVQTAQLNTTNFIHS
jgi:hypothetical protein